MTPTALRERMRRLDELARGVLSAVTVVLVCQRYSAVSFSAQRAAMESKSVSEFLDFRDVELMTAIRTSRIWRQRQERSNVRIKERKPREKN
jgi:hypothetical protein